MAIDEWNVTNQRQSTRTWGEIIGSLAALVYQVEDKSYEKNLLDHSEQLISTGRNPLDN